MQTDLLDALVPNLLTFIATMIVYRILKKGKTPVVFITLGMVVIGLVLGALGILA
ncbi:MAG: PTS system mannose/fructose/sorbose family transporter subunit IID [Firmicutes bacterium]|nr:PTS system mannose/fructose/sorbose family transporter subunit IID [Bacillota bacterium]